MEQSTTEFDKELSELNTLKFDPQTSLTADIVGGAVATVTDFGASIFNSLTPERYNVETQDLLAGISDNALRVYSEHPDTIHTLSFVGGVFAPATGVMKVMGALRFGIKGVSWFSEEQRLQKLAQLDTLYRGSVAATADYKKARNLFYAREAGNVLLDNVAIEAAIVGTMSAHPFMDDYNKEFVSNFAYNVINPLNPFVTAFHGIGHVVARSAVKNIEIGVAQEASALLRQGIRDSSQYINLSDRVSAQTANIRTWENILKSSKDLEVGTGGVGPVHNLDTYTKEMAESFLSSERFARQQVFEEMISPVIRSMPQEYKESLLQRIIDDPQRFAGIDKIDFIKPTDASILAQKKGSLFQDVKDIVNTDIPFISQKDNGRLYANKIVYSPEEDAFYHMRDERSFAKAVDAGYTEKNITTGMSKEYGQFPRIDFSIESMTKGTAAIDAEYLKAISFFDKMSNEDFAKAVYAVAPDDIPMMQGLYIRAQRLAAEAPELARDFKIAITKQLPNWDNIQVQTARTQGVSEQYIKELRSIEKNFDNYDYRKGNISGSESAIEAISDWIGGRYTLRKMVADHFHSGKQSTIVQELYNSKQSIALRQALKQQADANGYIYLYRGMRNNAFTHATVASYTTNIAKAKEFGSVQLYKIKPEEILVAFQDNAGHQLKGQNYEILVMSPTRETAEIVKSGTTATDTVSNIISNNSKKSSVFGDITALYDNLTLAKANEVKSLLEQGIPLETIALRTNIPLDTVQAVVSNGNIDDGFMRGINKYNSASEIGIYLDPTKRSVSLTTNINKVPHALIKAKMDTQALQDIDKYVIEEFYHQSNSDIVKTFASVATSDIQQAWRARIRQGLDKIVSEAIGMKLLQSSNFALRKLGDVGDVIAQSGKNFSQLVNKVAKEKLTPLSSKMEGLIKDAPALSEFNTAMSIEAGIKGYKKFDIETGMWMQQSEANPWKIIKNEKGKVISKERNMVPVQYNNSDYVVVTPLVREIIGDMDTLGREFYEMNSTIRQIRGLPNMNDVGFWRPPVNVRNKHIAYVFDGIKYKTTMLYGNTKEELAEVTQLYKQAHPEEITRGTVKVVDKSELARFNVLQGRHDPVFMEVADSSMLRTGSMAPAVISGNADILAELMGGYDHYIGYGMRQLLMDQNSDIFQHMERLTNLAGNGIIDQPLGSVARKQHVTTDAGSVIRNTLLGAADLKEYQGWSAIQDGMEAITEVGLRIMRDIVTPLISPAREGVSALLGKNTTREDYVKLVHDMEARGIRSPYEDLADDMAFQRYQVDSMAKIPGMTPRVIALGSSIASTMLLRVGELAQAATNLISLPILMSSAITRQYDKMFLEGTLSRDASFLGMKTMYNGIRRMNDPKMEHYFKYAEENGIFKPIVSEVNDLLHNIYSFNPDKIRHIDNLFASKKTADPKLIAKLEQELETVIETGDNKQARVLLDKLKELRMNGQDTLIGLLSKPSDFSESFVRKWAFATGIELASTRYKDLSDISKMTFARSFVDEVVGNYAAAQRPVIFQGNMGVAMGLFQTYMVTYGQSLFRHAENQDWKALSKMMLMQGGIFGAESLPGFKQVSEYIGEHFSDQNYDLQTGTYRALPDKLADIILYGLPSNIAPTFTTRGDIAPRIPNIAGGLQNLPTINLLASAYTASERILQAALHTDENTFRAVGEALSLQSISRPIARLSELATGTSITSRGNVVAGPDEVRSVQGVMARVFATRPVQELKAREAMHLNTVYGSIDYDARQEVTKQLKTHLRAGTLSSEVIDKLAAKYMRTGSPTGWRSAVNTAIGQAANPNTAVMNYLNPRSPTQLMIEEMD